jgi:hypothetical protein
VSAATIDELRASLFQPQAALPPDYVAKMMHRVPDAPVVDREAFILERCAGRRVLELGASGALHARLVTDALAVIGIDRHAADGVIGFDLDDVTQPQLPVDALFPEIIVAGEVLEHLGNPGYLLQRCRRQYTCPLIVTVPNAFSDIARKHMLKGTENVNVEHVSWYSWHTLRTLAQRVGYDVAEMAWYHGEPRTAEGLIVLLKGGA